MSNHVKPWMSAFWKQSFLTISMVYKNELIAVKAWTTSIFQLKSFLYHQNNCLVFVVESLVQEFIGGRPSMNLIPDTLDQSLRRFVQVHWTTSSFWIVFSKTQSFFTFSTKLYLAVMIVRTTTDLMWEQQTRQDII